MKQAVKQRDRQAGRQAGRQTGRQVDRQAGRQAGRLDLKAYDWTGGAGAKASCILMQIL